MSNLTQNEINNNSTNTDEFIPEENHKEDSNHEIQKTQVYNDKENVGIDSESTKNYNSESKFQENDRGHEKDETNVHENNKYNSDEPEGNLDNLNSQTETSKKIEKENTEISASSHEIINEGDQKFQKENSDIESTLPNIKDYDSKLEENQSEKEENTNIDAMSEEIESNQQKEEKNYQFVNCSNVLKNMYLGYSAQVEEIDTNDSQTLNNEHMENAKINENIDKIKNSKDDVNNFKPMPKNSVLLNKQIIQINSYYNSSEWVEKLKNQKDTSPDNYVALDINQITDALYHNKKFANENINLILSEVYLTAESENQEAMYLSHLTDSKFTYDGVLNKYFERSKIGKNTFANGDIYIGNWKNDKRDGFGLYFYKSEGNDAISKLFVGIFGDDGKKKEGFYFDFTGNLSEGNVSFEAFKGIFDSDENMERGIFISLNNDITKSYVYFGHFTENKKHDDDGILYLIESRRLFMGKFDNDMITLGNLFELTSENQIKSVVKYNSTTGKREVCEELDIEEQFKKAQDFLSANDTNELIVSFREISRNCLFLEDNWRNMRITNDGDVISLSEDLQKVTEIFNKP